MIRGRAIFVLVLTAACSSSDGTATPPANGSVDSSSNETTSTGDAAATTTSSSIDEPSTTTTLPTATSTTETDPSTAPTTDASMGASTTDSAASSTTTVAATTTTFAALSPSQLADQELARSALLTLDAFPDDWVEEPADGGDSADTAAFEAEFDACLGRDDSARVGDDLEALTVSTGDFHPDGDDTTSVAHEVVLAPDEATAITAMAEVAVDGAEPCLADVIQRFYVASFADVPELEDIGVGEVVVTGIEAVGASRDVEVGVQLEVPLVLDGQSVSQFLELLYQRRGRALSELSLSSFGAPFGPSALEILRDEVGVRLGAVGS